MWAKVTCSIHHGVDAAFCGAFVILVHDIEASQTWLMLLCHMMRGHFPSVCVLKHHMPPVEALMVVSYAPKNF
jgi:hypothetical protein